MKPGKNNISKIIALSAFVLTTAGAVAQESPRPSKTVESFQNWTVECNSIAVRPTKAAEKTAKKGDKKKTSAVKKAPPQKKFRQICEAIQTYTNRKTGNEIARLAFAVDEKKDSSFVAGLRTVVDVSFTKTPAIVVAGKEVFSGKFSRCAARRCYVLFSDVTEKKIAELTKAKAVAVQYPIARGQMLRIKISTKGLSDSLKALKAKKK